jgi:hypothetical protein
MSWTPMNVEAPQRHGTQAQGCMQNQIVYLGTIASIPAAHQSAKSPADLWGTLLAGERKLASIAFGATSN